MRPFFPWLAATRTSEQANAVTRRSRSINSGVLGDAASYPHGFCRTPYGQVAAIFAALKVTSWLMMTVRTTALTSDGTAAPLALIAPR
ncbi:hypothetical protein KCP71_11705 [Salmonella enterica subsp. enterica]|nr:hypothetical protein KCP71_11705 [Salmonella enterica subsp. enterica]